MTDRSEWPLAGPILDELDVRLDLDAAERVSECLVIAKTHNLATGCVSLITASSEGLDWVARRGLLASASEVTAKSTDLALGDDDD